MRFTTLSLIALFETLSLAASIPSTNTSNACANSRWTQPKVTIKEAMANWGKIWKGDFALVNQTVTPDIAIWTDRLPVPSPSMLSGNATNPHMSEYVLVTNQEQFVNYLKISKTGFASYGFVNQFWFVNSEGNKLVARWTLDAVVGNDTTSTIRKPGDRVAMNGTDIVLFDDCSGRIQQVLTAQDILAFAHEMGIDVASDSPRKL